jgi:hypothetical protein
MKSRERLKSALSGFYFFTALGMIFNVGFGSLSFAMEHKAPDGNRARTKNNSRRNTGVLKTPQLSFGESHQLPSDALALVAEFSDQKTLANFAQVTKGLARAPTYLTFFRLESKPGVLEKINYKNSRTMRAIEESPHLKSVWLSNLTFEPLAFQRLVASLPASTESLKISRCAGPGTKHGGQPKARAPIKSKRRAQVESEPQAQLQSLIYSLRYRGKSICGPFSAPQFRVLTIFVL